MQPKEREGSHTLLCSDRRTQQQILGSHLHKVLRLTREVDHTDAILTELQSTSALLHRDRATLLDQLTAISADLRAISARSGRLREEQRDRRQELAAHRATVFDPLKDRVEELRATCGLPRLPGLQDIIEAENAAYLGERLRRWRDVGVTEEGIEDDDGSSAQNEQQSSSRRGAGRPSDGPSTSATSTAAMIARRPLSGATSRASSSQRRVSSSASTNHDDSFNPRKTPSASAGDPASEPRRRGGPPKARPTPSLTDVAETSATPSGAKPRNVIRLSHRAPPGDAASDPDAIPRKRRKTRH